MTEHSKKQTPTSDRRNSARFTPGRSYARWQIPVLAGSVYVLGSYLVLPFVHLGDIVGLWVLIAFLGVGIGWRINSILRRRYWTWLGRHDRYSARRSSYSLSLLGMATFSALGALSTNERVWLLGLSVVMPLCAVSIATNIGVLQERRRPPEVVVVGSMAESPETFDSARRFAESVDGYVVGIVTTETEPASLSLSIPVLGAIGSAEAQEHFANTDFVFLDGGHPRVLHRLLWSLDGTDVLVVPRLNDRSSFVTSERILLSNGTVAFLPRRPQKLASLFKRAFDWAASLVLLLILAPILVAIAIAIRLNSPGPVLYSQTRIGSGGVPFRFLKFRTMRVDSDLLMRDFFERTSASGVLFKTALDPRVTGVGRFLRRFSLDELPSLLNVMAGSMSLVGPRPALPAEVEFYEEAATRRLETKPGITGLWQISGRSDLSWEQSLRLDLWYIDNWTIGLDLRILARTLGAVLNSRGAY